MTGVETAIRDPLPTVEEILLRYRQDLGRDFEAYRNHVYRVWHYCMAFRGPDRAEGDEEKVAVAGCFHDLGIWTHGTFDYLDPSAEMARKYLEEKGKPEDFHDVGRMVHFHHKITRYREADGALVEAFRKADWLDVSLGKRRFGLDRGRIRPIYRAFPSLGFYGRLTELTLRRLRTAPLRPLPMFKW